MRAKTTCFEKKSIGAFLPSTIFLKNVPDKFHALLAKGNKFVRVLLNHSVFNNEERFGALC